MFTKAFWKQAGERAVKTAAQTFVAVAAPSQVFDVFHASWGEIAGVTVGAAILSVATSLGSTAKGDHESPSLVGE